MISAVLEACGTAVVWNYSLARVHNTTFEFNIPTRLENFLNPQKRPGLELVISSMRFLDATVVCLSCQKQT